MRRRDVLQGVVLAAGAGIAGRTARAAPAKDVLRIAWRDGIPNVDPYYNTLRTGLVVAHHAWDTLVYRDPDTLQIKPLLATSWRKASDTALEFTLRQGVTFHNGDPFTADDVAYTVNTVIQDPRVAVPGNYAFIDGADRLDDFRVRIRLKHVFPAALEYFAMVLPIWPKAYREKIGAEAYAKAPVGTGPYAITRLDDTRRIEMQRYDQYFGGPKGKPAIRVLAIDEVANTEAELAALLGGHADWIWQFNADAFNRLAQVPALQVLSVESMRLAYLSMDAAGRTGAGNPLTKLKVRQAICHAVDRRSMAGQMVGGGSRALNVPCYPTQFGCDTSAATRYDYDPAQAKQLLADAGYPNGFTMPLVSYVLPQWTQAIAGYLKAVNIEAPVTELPTEAVMQRVRAGKTPLYLGTWGSYTINDVSAILPFFFGGGDADYARDPEVEKLVAQGGSTTDIDQRRSAYSAAIQRITEQALWLPLFTLATTYAFSRDLVFKAYPDELPRFFLARWKQ